jgi:hypothetical protein
LEGEKKEFLSVHDLRKVLECKLVGSFVQFSAGVSVRKSPANYRFLLGTWGNTNKETISNI